MTYSKFVLRMVWRLSLAALVVFILFAVFFFGAAIAGSSSAQNSFPYFIGAGLVTLAWAIWPMATYSRRSAVVVVSAWLAMAPMVLLVQSPLAQGVLAGWFCSTVFLALWASFTSPNLLQSIEANEARRNEEAADRHGGA